MSRNEKIAMVNNALTPASLETILQILRQVVDDLQVLYVFGSAAQGVSHPMSDLDVAVLTPKALDPVERWEVQEQLAQQLQRDVDLVDLRAATTVMRMEVVRTGQVLYSEPESARHWFEMETLSAYALLNQERAGILADIEARGQVYAG